VEKIKCCNFHSRQYLKLPLGFICLRTLRRISFWSSAKELFSVCSLASVLCTQKSKLQIVSVYLVTERTYTHTHTHTHIYIYIYIYICNHLQVPSSIIQAYILIFISAINNIIIRIFWDIVDDIINYLIRIHLLVYVHQGNCVPDDSLGKTYFRLPIVWDVFFYLHCLLIR
jgi:hypothetical protein